MHEVRQLQRRLTEEGIATLPLQHQQAPQDGVYRGFGYPEAGAQLLAVVAQVFQGGAQVGQVHQQHALVVGELEHQREHALLGFVQLQQARQQLGTHFRNGGAHRRALFAEHVPESHRVAALAVVLYADLCHPLVYSGVGRARLADAGDIPLHIGQEHRHAQIGKTLCQALQGNGLAGTGGSGHQAVAIGVFRVQGNLAGLVAAYENTLGHDLDFLLGERAQGIMIARRLPVFAAVLR